MADAKPIVALEANGREAGELRKEQWFLSELCALKSNGEPLCAPQTKLRARPVIGDVAAIDRVHAAKDDVALRDFLDHFGIPEVFLDGDEARAEADSLDGDGQDADGRSRIGPIKNTTCRRNHPIPNILSMLLHFQSTMVANGRRTTPQIFISPQSICNDPPSTPPICGCFRGVWKPSAGRRSVVDAAVNSEPLYSGTRGINRRDCVRAIERAASAPRRLAGIFSERRGRFSNKWMRWLRQPSLTDVARLGGCLWDSIRRCRPAIYGQRW